MAKRDDNLEWSDVDLSTLSKPARKAWDAYKAASKAAGEARTAFTDQFSKDIDKAGLVPDGQYPRFSFNFGKLGIAFTDTPPTERKGSKGAFKAS
jgi:hypothetical protein